MTCPICESPDTACVSDSRIVNHVQKAHVEIDHMYFHRCNDCELIYRDPMPSQAELDHFYQTEYRQEAPDSPSLASYFRAQADHRIAILTSRGTRAAEDEWVPALPQGGYAIDIGAGCGAFVERLQPRSRYGDRWQAVGLEANEEYANRPGAAMVFHGNVEEWSPSLEKVYVGNGVTMYDEGQLYKLITMFHVLEHLRDPVSVLAKIRGWLAPEGRLWIEVPDMDHPLKGDIQREFIYPHLWGFNGTNILIVLSAAGWVCADLFRKTSDYTGRTSLHVIARVP